VIHPYRAKEETACWLTKDEPSSQVGYSSVTISMYFCIASSGGIAPNFCHACLQRGAMTQVREKKTLVAQLHTIFRNSTSDIRQTLRLKKKSSHYLY